MYSFRGAYSAILDLRLEQHSLAPRSVLPHGIEALYERAHSIARRLR